MARNVTEVQVAAVLSAVQGVLGDIVAGAYLYGSAVDGGLQPASDIDVLVVVHQATTRAQRMALADALKPLSRRGLRPNGWRPVELVVVAQADVKPLEIPPRTDFQYGEWLRDGIDAGLVDPAEPENPDLVVLLAQARSTGRALAGPAPAQLIGDVSRADLDWAMRASIDGLLGDLDSDTANVLLTLARIWHTLETGEFTTKDAAAAWAAARMSHGEALLRAAQVYRAEVADEWTLVEVRSAAGELTDRIGRG